MTPDSNGTAIEWTHRPGTKGETWNPIAGCDIKSPGCAGCYAMRQARRIELMAKGLGRKTHYAGTTRVVNGNPIWTGKIAVAPDDVWLKPLRWKSPRTIFVNSMSDLFHPAVKDETIDRVFATAAITPWHTYIILTKRPDRMRQYFAETWQRAPAQTLKWEGETLDIPAEHRPGDRWDQIDRAIDALPIPEDDRFWTPEGNLIGRPAWPRRPLPNVWLGVSVERQQEADERREDIRTIAAAGWTTIVSYEPALGPVDWTGWEFIKQLIAGGESGPRARPGHPDWYRAARDFAVTHGIAFFFKQWGQWVSVSCQEGQPVDWHTFPDGATVKRLAGGKKAAGRILDGVEHSNFPSTERTLA